MRLVFKKDESLEISVSSLDDGSAVEFKYLDLIRNLIKVKKLDEPELIGDFSESEKLSIASMINHINGVVTDFYSECNEGDEGETKIT